MLYSQPHIESLQGAILLNAYHTPEADDLIPSYREETRLPTAGIVRTGEDTKVRPAGFRQRSVQRADILTICRFTVSAASSQKFVLCAGGQSMEESVRQI